VLRAHEAKFTCTELSLILINTRNFVLHCYPSLTVQEVELDKEHEDEEKW